jgi:hypothetical protein
MTARERHEDVQPALSAGLEHARQVEQLEDAAHRERDLDHVGPRRLVARVEIDHREVGFGQRREPAREAVIGEARLVDHPEQCVLVFDHDAAHTLDPRGT